MRPLQTSASSYASSPPSHSTPLHTGPTRALPAHSSAYPSLPSQPCPSPPAIPYISARRLSNASASLTAHPTPSPLSSYTVWSPSHAQRPWIQSTPRRPTTVGTLETLPHPSVAVCSDSAACLFLRACGTEDGRKGRLKGVHPLLRFVYGSTSHPSLSNPIHPSAHQPIAPPYHCLPPNPTHFPAY